MSEGEPANNIPVPQFKKYFPSEADMDRVQRRFYRTWLKHWQAGRPLGVQGNISYLFCYVYTVLALPPKKAAQRLKEIIDGYKTEDKAVEYCERWLSDCYVLMGDCYKALEAYPVIPINSRSATCTDDVLSLKLQISRHISGRDILTLNGPKVTKWAKEHLYQVAGYLEVIVSAYEDNNAVNLLEKWSKTAHRYPYQVFRGTPLSNEAGIPCYSFSMDEQAVQFITEKTKDAENSVREECNIPRIGEGWVSETSLFYELRKALPDNNVLHHARPEWLGKQHLDIFVPDYSVAIEFQGAQHDQPVEYFGGEKAFEATRRRDARKKGLCTKHGVRLIYVRSGYNIQEIVEEVVTCRE